MDTKQKETERYLENNDKLINYLKSKNDYVSNYLIAEVYIEAYNLGKRNEDLIKVLDYSLKSQTKYNDSSQNPAYLGKPSIEDVNYFIQQTLKIG